MKKKKGPPEKRGRPGFFGKYRLRAGAAVVLSRRLPRLPRYGGGECTGI